jgi:hypothetical protein
VVFNIFGKKIKATHIVENRRAIEHRELINCWVIPAAVDFKVVLPQSVKEVGNSQVTTCGCCGYFALYYESFTQRTTFLIGQALFVPIRDLSGFIPVLSTLSGVFGINV